MVAGAATPFVMTTVCVAPVLVCRISTALPMLQLQDLLLPSLNVTLPLLVQTLLSTTVTGVVVVVCEQNPGLANAYAVLLVVVLVTAPSVVVTSVL
jgi:phage tail protein X